MKLIDKDAVVAEIERLKNADLSHLNGEQVNIYLNTLDLVETAICTLKVEEPEKQERHVGQFYHGRCWDDGNF